MRIIFDITTPKTCLFFWKLGDLLKERRHEIFYVGRTYYESNRMQDILNMKVKLIGYHGGATLQGKLKSSIERCNELMNYFNMLEPDLFVSLSSVDGSRAAFGLNIPTICFNDIPEAQHTARLTIPLADKVFIPFVIPPQKIKELGAKNIIVYNSLDPVLWLQDWEINDEIIKNLKMDKEKPVIVFREEETKSSYLSMGESFVINVVQKLAEKHKDWQFLSLPRYSTPHFKKELSNVVILPPATDMVSLLASSDLFLGGGGTMNIESAYFGTPTINLRPLTCYYENYLIERGLSFKPELNINSVIELSEAIINKRFDAEADKVFKKLKFPKEQILSEIEKTGE